MNAHIKEIGLIVLCLLGSLVIGMLLSHQFVLIYQYVTGTALGTSFLDFSEIIGLIFGAYFFGLLSLGYMRSVISKVVSAILLLAMSLFFFQAEPDLLYFPFVLGIVGYGIGWGGRWVVAKFRN